MNRGYPNLKKLSHQRVDKVKKTHQTTNLIKTVFNG